MNSFKRKSGLFFICIGVLLLHFATSANAGRPLIPLSGGRPAIDVRTDKACPSMQDDITLNISTARGTEGNIVDIYGILLRPDGHFFSLNSLSQPDVVTPLFTSWDVVTADNITATFPMSQLPINEAGFYSFYIGFFEPQNTSSTGRPLIPLIHTPPNPPGIVAAATDNIHTDPHQTPPPNCICNSKMWNLLYHATTTIDIGVYKLTAVWDGTLALDATVDRPRPLVPLTGNGQFVTGSGTITLNEALAIPSLGCTGTVNNSAQVTVDGGTNAGKFDLTINTPSIDTSITSTCPDASFVTPFNIPANSSNVSIPAVNGAEMDTVQTIPLPSGRPLVLLTTPPSGPSIKTEGNYKLSCKG